MNSIYLLFYISFYLPLKVFFFKSFNILTTNFFLRVKITIIWISLNFTSFYFCFLTFKSCILYPVCYLKFKYWTYFKGILNSRTQQTCFKQISFVSFCHTTNTLTCFSFPSSFTNPILHHKSPATCHKLPPYYLSPDTSQNPLCFNISLMSLQIKLPQRAVLFGADAV